MKLCRLCGLGLRFWKLSIYTDAFHWVQRGLVRQILSNALSGYPGFDGIRLKVCAVGSTLWFLAMKPTLPLALHPKDHDAVTLKPKRLSATQTRLP